MFQQVWRQRGPGGAGRLVTNHVEMPLIVGPLVEPVKLSEVKQHARIPYGDSDAILTTYIHAARERIERYLRRALITQTRDFIADWGTAWVELPYPNLQSVVGVYTTDLANGETVVSPSVYFVNPARRLVSLNIGQVWPIHRGLAGFRIRYVAGYGDTPDTVPYAIRKEILSLVAQFDDIRETTDLPLITQASLRPYRIEGDPFRMAPGVAREDVLG